MEYRNGYNRWRWNRLRRDNRKWEETMIKVSSKKNKYTYNVYHLVKAFFPNEEIIQNVDEKQESLVALNLPGGSCFSIALEEVEAAACDKRLALLVRILCY